MHSIYMDEMVESNMHAILLLSIPINTTVFPWKKWNEWVWHEYKKTVSERNSGESAKKTYSCRVVVGATKVNFHMKFFTHSSLLSLMIFNLRRNRVCGCESPCTCNIEHVKVYKSSFVEHVFILSGSCSCFFFRRPDHPSIDGFIIFLSSLSFAFVAIYCSCDVVICWAAIKNEAKKTN